MIALIIAAQLLLPLALIAWLVLAPARSLAGLALQICGTGAVIFALGMVGLWAVPAWWLPRAFAGLWLTAALGSLVRRRPGTLPLWSLRWRAWTGAALSLALLVLGCSVAVQALAGRRPPAAAVTDMASPFGPGEFLVGQGGSTLMINAHLRTLDEKVARFRAWRGQSYGLDFVGVGPWGLRASGLRPTDPALYAIFGTSVHAPCAGHVVATEGDMPDLEVPHQDLVNRLGNHVILRCDEAEVVLAHLQRGSISVAAGDEVAVGTRLAAVGNSGASSEPHLHIHAQRAPLDDAPPISGQPLALCIDGRFLVQGDRLRGTVW